MHQCAGIVFTDTEGSSLAVVESPGAGNLQCSIFAVCRGLSIYPSFDIGNLLCQTLQENSIVRKGSTPGELFAEKRRNPGLLHPHCRLKRNTPAVRHWDEIRIIT
jgi:hypothetical protein